MTIKNIIFNGTAEAALSLIQSFTQSYNRVPNSLYDLKEKLLSNVYEVMDYICEYIIKYNKAETVHNENINKIFLRAHINEKEFR